MFAQLLCPNAAEHEPLLDHVGIALIEHAAATGHPPKGDTAPQLANIRRSVVNAYRQWWLGLPWWKALWLSGSSERRFRHFTDHARRCGLIEKWAKRTVIGIHAIH